MAHVAVGYGETGLIDGFLKHQIDDSFKPLLRVYGEVRHLLHQLCKHLGRQFIQDAAHLPEKLLPEEHKKKNPNVTQIKQYETYRQNGSVTRQDDITEASMVLSQNVWLFVLEQIWIFAYNYRLHYFISFDSELNSFQFQY